MVGTLTSSDPLCWYAVWTHSRHEQVVRRGLEHRNIETFLPTIMRLSRWTDRRKRMEWPLFPGYCFARFNALHRLPVLQCHGVLRIVSIDGTPAPIPDAELDSLRRLVDTHSCCDPCALLQEGARVEVVQGPLRGVIGRLLRKEAGKAMVVLSVDLIAQAVRVTVDAGDISPL